MISAVDMDAMREIEGQEAMQLYTAHLPSLGGFYASDIYLVASSLEAAKALAMNAVQEHVAESIETFGTFFRAEADPEDDEWEGNLLAFYGRFQADLDHSLKVVEDNYTLLVRG